MTREDQRERVRTACEALPLSERSNPFGPEVDVYKVDGRMFAVLTVVGDPGRVTLKCDPDLSEALRAEYAGITPGYHANKRHWITVAFDALVPTELCCALVEDSHALVARRRRR